MIEDTLPELLQQVETELGYAAMLKFAHAFGGQSIYVPQKPGAKSPLTKKLGEELALDIARVLGVGKITVPLGPTTNQARFRIAVAKKLEEKKSANVIAAELHCHEVTVRRHRKRLKGGTADPRQVDLFRTDE